MRVRRIRIKNFRSFGNEGINLRLKDGLNMIVGENNVGKSNIMRALKLLADILDAKINDINKSDFYKGVTGKELEIFVDFELSDKYLDEVYQIIKKSIQKSDGSLDENFFNVFKKVFGRKVKIILTHKMGDKLKDDILFKWDILYLHVSEAFLNIKDRHLKSRSVCALEDIINYIKPHSENVTELYKPFPKNEGSNYNGISKKQIKDAIRMRLGKERAALKIDVYPVFMKAFKENFKLFEDIRQKPIGSGSGALESFDGSSVPDVLFNLRNDDEDVYSDLYDSIKGKFSDLFNHDLVLAAVRRRSDNIPYIKITDKTTGYKGDLNSMGTGIIEIVIFLTGIIGSTNRVYGIEDPELHLHPHGQRLLLGILEEYEKNNQIILISHSPIFIDVKYTDKIILVRKGEGGTTIAQLSNDYFNKQEKAKLEKNLDAESKEIFFSRAVLLVEGETEKGALPVFAKKLESDFDKNGVSVVWVGGKDNLEIFIKLLEGFNIPYFIEVDKDAIMALAGGRIDNVETSSLFRQLYNRNLLTEEEVNRIKGLASQIEVVNNNGKKRYKEDLFEDLKIIALNHNCFVLSRDFEEILKEAGYGDLMEEAKNIVGKNSKPRIGRYVAEKIVEPGKEIPKEFEEVISKVHQIVEWK